MPCFKDNKCILNTSIHTQCIVLLVIHSVSIMLSIFLYKMVKILNGINTKHKSAEKNTGQCFSIELHSHAKIFRTNVSKIQKRAKIRHRSVMLSALQFFKANSFHSDDFLSFLLVLFFYQF